MRVTMTGTRRIPGYGLRVEGQTYDFPDELARQLERQGLGITQRVTGKKRKHKGSIDLSDGVSDEEANLAGRTLSQKAQED